jgi:cytochrome P450
LSDLFLAGSETTSNTLTFGLLLMLLSPESQRKAQAEITNVVPREREPCLADAERFDRFLYNGE